MKQTLPRRAPSALLVASLFVQRSCIWPVILQRHPRSHLSVYRSRYEEVRRNYYTIRVRTRHTRPQPDLQGHMSCDCMAVGWGRPMEGGIGSLDSKGVYNYTSQEP